MADGCTISGIDKEPERHPLQQQSVFGLLARRDTRIVRIRKNAHHVPRFTTRTVELRMAS